MGGAAFCLAGYICLEAFLVFIALGEGTVSGVLWVEARNATKYPTMHRTAPSTENYSVIPNGTLLILFRKNINNAEGEEP